MAYRELSMAIRAAIYARKSTKQDDVEKDAKSVETQTDSARPFIKKKGWSLDEGHVYTDDGVSGALFAKRAEFQRMMRDAAAGNFEVLVLFDLDRFGRHAQKTLDALHKLADLGVSVWDSATEREVDLDSFEGRLTATFQAEFAQQFRDQIRKHTREAMRKKAAQGWHTHGKVFGYDVKRVGPGHCELHINASEAAVVREIYRRFADGEGARTIAGFLNRRKMPKPRAQQGRHDGWSVSTVRSVLNRPLYRGEIVYGRTAKAYGRELKRVYRETTREKGQIPKPEETWIRVDPKIAAEVEARVRIIDPEVAERVDERLADKRERYLAAVAKGDNRAPHKTHGKYLLSGGMLICQVCGGHFEGRQNPWRQKEPGGHPAHVYVCSTRRRKPGVCGNTLALSIEEADEVILSEIEGEVLGTTYINTLLEMVDDSPDETLWLTAERDRLQTEIDRLVASIAAGVPPDAIAPRILENRAAIARLEGKLHIPRVPRLDKQRLRAALEQRAEEWKAQLRAEPAIARMVLRKLVGPIYLWDERERPDFVKYETAPKTELLDGLAPTLLLASPMPASWNQIVPWLQQIEELRRAA
jgi:site-specific DNA recombinase